MVESQILAGVLAGKFVNLHRIHLSGSAHIAKNSQNACTGTHVHNFKPLEIHGQEAAQYECGGGMVTCTESHLGIDYYVISAHGHILMKRGVDGAEVIDDYGLEIVLFPLCVPVLTLHKSIGSGNGGVEWEVGDDVILETLGRSL